MLPIMMTQTNGLQILKSRVLTEPIYYSEHEKYDSNRGNVEEYQSLELDAGDKEVEDKQQMKSEYSDVEEKESRRLFEWFSRLFQTTTPKVIQTTITSTEAMYEKELKERIFLRALQRNLTDVLYRLGDIEKRVSSAMEQKESYAILTKSKPYVLGLNNAYYYRNRLKRDLSEVIKLDTDARTAVNASDNNINKTTDKVDNVNVLNATASPCDSNVTNYRRSGSIMTTPTEVKNKLLQYLEESFQEIKRKIIALKDLKQAFSDNVSFKIGYIIANIDTLEVSLVNLKNNMERNKEVWEDNKILDLFDTLKVSNQAVSGLIDTLKVYLEKLSDTQTV